MMTTMTAEQTGIIGTLDRHVANASDLASQLKQAHWAIVGPNFIALHELFDQQVTLVRGYIDEYAERMRALGGMPCGTVRAAASRSELPDFPGGEVRERDVVQALVERFEQYSALLTEAREQAAEQGDATTEDIYIEAQREIDRHAWFLRSHLK
jgi:starvation-inducible DNA-binding protein